MLGTPVALGDEAESASASKGKTTDTVYVINTARDRSLSSSRFTAPVLDTPQTLAIIPQEVFLSQGADTLIEVLRNTPGISFNAGENGFATSNSNFSLRGVDASGNIFVDGVRDSGNFSRDMFNIEQVEVVKGPAAENGRGGAGGFVNIVSKAPRADTFLNLSSSIGFDDDSSDERLRATLDANHAFANSGAALRLNLMVQDGGIAGREFAESDAWGIAPAFAFDIGDATRATLSAQHVDQSGIPDWGVPAAMIDGMMRFDRAAARADRSTFYGLASDFDDIESSSALARIEHAFSPALTLSNQTRWGETDRNAVYTVPFLYDPLTSLVTTDTQAFSRKTRSLSNLTELTLAFGSGDLQHSLATGIDLTREESDADRFGTNPAGLVDVLDPDPRRLPAWDAVPVEDNAVDLDTIGAYAYTTLRFTEQWQLTGGLRVERYDVDIDSRVAATGEPTGPDGYSVSDTTLSGRLGVVYKPSANSSVYLAFGSSTLPPGSWLSNPDISRTGDNAFPGLVGQNNEEAKTQRSNMVELGSKWNLLDDRLSVTAAAFYTERENVAISGKTPGDPASPTVLQGYGKQVIEGLEFSVTGSLTERWSILAGLLLMDTERRHSAFLDAARREANPTDYGTALRTSGDELAYTPDVSANLWTTYSFPFGLTIGGGIQHVGESWAGRPDDADRIIPNGNFGKLPDYTVANLMASWQFGESLFLRLNVDNVTDELYATSANWPAQRVLLGAPRSYIVSADFRF